MIAHSKIVTMVVVKIAIVVAIVEVAAYVGRHKGMKADSSNSNNQSIKGSRQRDRQAGSTRLLTA